MSKNLTITNNSNQPTEFGSILAELAKQKASTESEKQLRETIIAYANIMAHDQRTPIAVLKIKTIFFQEIYEQLIKNYHAPAKSNNPKTPNLSANIDLAEFKHSIADLNMYSQNE